jgi:hypothetical protein
MRAITYNSAGQMHTLKRILMGLLRFVIIITAAVIVLSVATYLWFTLGMSLWDLYGPDAFQYYLMGSALIMAIVLVIVW